MMKARLTGLLACLLLLSSPVFSQRADFGDYRVLYSVVNSTFLTPDIAEQYGITRGPRRAFLNIAVQKVSNDASPEAVTAVIEGERSNLMQQNERIDFKEIQEGTAIYYIGEFEFSNAEPVIFRLDIQPEGSGPSYPLQWDTRVYQQ